MKFDRDKWLAERRKGLGATDAAPILKCSPTRTGAHVVAEKREGIITQEESEAMAYGTILEPVILKLYTMKTGIKPRRINRILHHPKYDWMTASLDAITKPAVIEAKMAMFPRGEFGDDGTDQIPDHYNIQVQHQLAVTGKEVAEVPVFVPGKMFRIYRIEANIRIQQIIIEEEKEFWERYIVHEEPLPFEFEHPATLDLVKRLYNRDDGGAIDLGDDIGEIATIYQDLGAEVSKKINARNAMKAEMLAVMGNAGLGYLPDGRYITRKEITKKPYEVKASSYIDMRIHKPVQTRIKKQGG